MTFSRPKMLIYERKVRNTRIENALFKTKYVSVHYTHLSSFCPNTNLCAYVHIILPTIVATCFSLLLYSDAAYVHINMWEFRT